MGRERVQCAAYLLCGVVKVAAQGDDGKMSVVHGSVSEWQDFGFGKVNDTGDATNGKKVNGIEFDRAGAGAHHHHTQCDIGEQKQDFCAEPRRVERGEMGDFHQPQSRKQQHGVVEVGQCLPQARQRFFGIFPKQEKADVEQQNGNGNEDLVAVFDNQILHGRLLSR